MQKLQSVNFIGQDLNKVYANELLKSFHLLINKRNWADFDSSIAVAPSA